MKSEKTNNILIENKFLQGVIIMAKARPDYEVNDEFNTMAKQIVSKYPEKFVNVDVDKICCVTITNKDRKQEVPETKQIWKTEAVKMPAKLHNPFNWYITVWSNDWDELEEKNRLALVAAALHSIPCDEDNEGKVNPCDTKGYYSVFATLGLDYLHSDNIPHLLNDKVEWK